ncbi:MAG: polymerase subunit delta [Patescibacteria group bacterium]|nr:polymerase subunit delta [Patescibacteria group bacterium]
MSDLISLRLLNLWFIIMFMKNVLNHHAYLIIGEKESGEEVISNIFKETEIETTQDPDVFVFDYERMYLEDAQALVAMENKSPVSLDFKYITLHIGSIVWEAQNALLKLFEDPGRTKFFIVSESKSLFLPTLLSRFEIIETPKKENTKRGGKKFLDASIAERLKMISSLLEEISEGKKSRRDARALLLDLRTSLKGIDPKKQSSVLHALKYASDTSSSLKLLLESIALSI